MNLGNFFQSIVFKFGLSALNTFGPPKAKEFLQKFHDSNPTVFAEVLITLYPLIDVQLEDYVKTTGNTVDDEEVSVLKKLLEDLAKDNNITLPNLDAGTVND